MGCRQIETIKIAEDALVWLSDKRQINYEKQLKISLLFYLCPITQRFVH